MLFETEAAIPEGKSVLIVLDKSGDTKLIWDSRNADEVATARRSFTDLKEKGFLAYKVTKTGDKAEQLHEFDPTAEKIIMSPAVRGG